MSVNITMKRRKRIKRKVQRKWNNRNINNLRVDLKNRLGQIWIVIKSMKKKRRRLLQTNFKMTRMMMTLKPIIIRARMVKNGRINQRVRTLFRPFIGQMQKIAGKRAGITKTAIWTRVKETLATNQKRTANKTKSSIYSASNQFLQKA